MNSSFSRRSFVGHSSALAVGLLGTLGVEKTTAVDPPPPGVVGTNPREFGARGDGSTDDTKAFQEALNAAGNSGTVCRIPAGLYRINGALTIPPGVTLCGVSGGVPHSEHPIGSVLLAHGGRGSAEGEPLLTLKPNAVLRNLTIHYPEQTVPDIIPYPWSIRIDGELCQVLDICLTNPYQAIDAGSCWNELHCIRNIFACPLKTGIYIDQCTDIGRVENVHFNPNFWTRMALAPSYPGSDIKAVLEKNLVGFKIGKTDWEYISNSFVIFARIGFHFDDFGHGPGNAVVSQSGSDICPVAVQVDKTQPHSGTQFVNGQFMSTVVIGPQNQGPIKMANCGFWGTESTQEQVRHEGASTLVLNGCHFTGWDASGKGAPCVRASGHRLLVNGCEFMDANKQGITLEKGLKAACITGNAFRGSKPVENQSGGDVQIGFNTTT